MADAKPHIHIIEDEADIVELISYNLRLDGLDVTSSATGEKGLESIKRIQPDLILLDLMLPGVDGLEICRQIKKDPQVSKIPVIMVTAKGSEQDVVIGLELGADDYIVKPFSPKVLVARVHAVLRRGGEKEVQEDDSLKIGELTIHPGRHEVLLAGQKLDLTFSEFRLLHFLSKRPGWVFTRAQIVDAIRGPDYPVTDRSIDVQVVGLRKKLGKWGDLIETVRGVGYRFSEIRE